MASDDPAEAPATPSPPTRDENDLLFHLFAACLLAIFTLSLISIFKAPSDWSSFTKTIDALITMASGLLIGRFARQR